MSDPVIIEARRLVETRTFMKGARVHVDGLAGYVREFLNKNGGLPNENGRPWSVESCADALKIPSGTLHRWMGIDQRESAPLQQREELQRRERAAQGSHAKAALQNPEQRRAVLEALPTETRDELRAELIDLDVPETTQCRHCRTHCP